VPRSDLSNDQARRIALVAQGFNDPRPSGPVDARHMRRVLQRVKLIQLDSVNVAVRSHYMPFFSRLGPYRQELLHEIAFKRRELFEYWGHEASLLPVEHHRLFRHRMDEAKPRFRSAKLFDERPDYADEILEEVRTRGPLAVSDLEEPGERSGPWWGYAPGKVALEWHFRTGNLTTHERRGFTRVYDITDRVLPDHALEHPTPTAEEAHRELLMLATEAHGVGTAKDLADYYRLKVPRARPHLEELVDAGRLERVAVEGWKQPAFLHPDAKLPRRVEPRALLTPFDSLVWLRERTSRLFNFDYTIEIYVPEAKRQYGYYTLPFMLDGQLVGRVDLKADRQASGLRAQASHIEPGADPNRVASELAEELRSMADWLELDSIEVRAKGNLSKELRAALAR
jgi:uncharacterized protein YcaQ